jgi:signal recognition particle subunit SRP19
VGEGSERRPLVLWPVYFEAGKSRSEGRRVPAHLAVKGVTAEAILKAAKAAGYEAEFDPNAKHPAHWFDNSGRVLVRTGEKKTVVLRKVALQLKRICAESEKGRSKERSMKR